eukprot:s167_g9.t1
MSLFDRHRKDPDEVWYVSEPENLIRIQGEEGSCGRPGRHGKQFDDLSCQVGRWGSVDQEFQGVPATQNNAKQTVTEEGIQGLFLTDASVWRLYSFSLKLKAKPSEIDQEDFKVGKKLVELFEKQFAKMALTGDHDILEALPANYQMGQQQDVTKILPFFFDKLGGSDQDRSRCIQRTLLCQRPLTVLQSYLEETDRQKVDFSRVEQFENWFLASAPSNPVLLRTLEIVREKFLWKVQKTIDFTGPGTLSDAVHEFLAASSEEHGISAEVARRTGQYAGKLSFPSESKRLFWQPQPVQARDRVDKGAPDLAFRTQKAEALARQRERELEKLKKRLEQALAAVKRKDKDTESPETRGKKVMNKADWTLKDHLVREARKSESASPSADDGIDVAGMASSSQNSGSDPEFLEDVDRRDEEPTEDQVIEYAEFLGMDLKTEEHLLWIAREGVAAPVPHPWKTCTEKGEVFYFNFETSESSWDHPSDAHYRELLEKHRKGLQGDEKQQGPVEAKPSKPADAKDEDMLWEFSGWVQAPGEVLCNRCGFHESWIYKDTG